MEPQLPTPSPSPEQGPLFRSEQAPRVPEYSPAPASPEREAHRESVSGGQGSEPTFAAPVAQQPPQSAPQLPPMPQTTDDSSDANPLLAADDDLIEKEWVEKAKKVIAETRHDPHLQEQAVSRLQADYLQKRYNKTVKVPTDG